MLRAFVHCLGAFASYTGVRSSKDLKIGFDFQKQKKRNQRSLVAPAVAM
jgi:hypothetical protein